jgi:hypothetical protein
MDKFMWGIVCFTFGIKKPMDVGHLFGPWLRIFFEKAKEPYTDRGGGFLLGLMDQ